LAAGTGALQNDHVRWLVTQPDHLAITGIGCIIVLFVWVGFRRMAINDARLSRGQDPVEADESEPVPAWPAILRIELAILLILTAILIAWAVLVPAPLEAPADPHHAPNPAKAPWFFIGFQEFLVYFDPWIAGAVLPLIILFGLLALPYLDTNPQGSCYYTLRQRPLAVVTFMFGFVVLWLVPVFIGTFLRGPNWAPMSLFEPWDTQQMTRQPERDFAELFFNAPEPDPGADPRVSSATLGFARHVPGITLIGLICVALPVLIQKLLFPDLMRATGISRYLLAWILWAGLLLVPLKMVLYWVFDVQYILTFGDGRWNI
jgi:hypothetical protein